MDVSGNVSNFTREQECKNLQGTLEFMWTHSQEALKQCLLLEEMLSKVSGSNFPAIIGRRPAQIRGKENQTQTIMVLLL